MEYREVVKRTRQLPGNPPGPHNQQTGVSPVTADGGKRERGFVVPPPLPAPAARKSPVIACCLQLACRCRELLIWAIGRQNSIACGVMEMTLQRALLRPVPLNCCCCGFTSSVEYFVSCPQIYIKVHYTSKSGTFLKSEDSPVVSKNGHFVFSLDLRVENPCES